MGCGYVLCAESFGGQSHDEGDQKQDQKYYEDCLGDPDGGARDA
jgi:hypothetical protein